TTKTQRAQRNTKEDKRSEFPNNCLLPSFVFLCALCVFVVKAFSSLRRLEVEPFDEFAGLLGAVVAVHAAVLPFYGQRPLVAGLVQRPDEALPVHAAVARRTELPATARVAGRQVGV